MAADDGYGVVGPALGGILGIPHAGMVIELTIENGEAAVTRELEEGLKEKLKVPLPAVLAAQTGLAEPRYVSIMGIRKVRKIPIEQIDPSGLAEGAVPGIEVLALSPPPAGRNVEILEGSTADLAGRVVDLVKEVAG